MNGRRQNTVPSNYVAIPVSETRRSQTVDRDRYLEDQLTVRIDLELRAAQPLHMGTGIVGREDGRLFLDITLGPDGKPRIPGAGIKGPIRTIFETLTGSCGELTCRPEAPCCAACSLFGCLGVQGRVGFDEAVFENGQEFGIVKLPQGYAPSTIKGRRFYGAFPPGAPAQHPYGVVPRGATFAGGLLVEHASAREVGLLCLSMGMDGSFLPKLGGGKHGGIGSVRFVPRAVRVLEARTRYGASGKPPEEDPVAWTRRLCAEAERSLEGAARKNLELLRATLK